MAVDFRICPARDLVIVTYEGFTPIEDTIALTRRYAAHPDYAPGQKLLFDLRRVTEVTRDYPKFFDVQALSAGVLGTADHEQLMAILATNEAGLRMAERAERPWTDVPSLVIVTHDNEVDALAFLGLPETTVAELHAVCDAAG